MSYSRVLGLAGVLSVLMASAASAAPVTYNVDFSLPEVYPPTGQSLAVTGTITTDGKIGSLSKDDILSVDVIFDGKHATTASISNFYGYDPVRTTASGDIAFYFVNQSFSNADRFILQDPFGNPYIQFFSESGYNFVSASDSGSTAQTSILPQNSSFLIGTTAVSSVPLPASAPMFGAALIAMGAVGYGVKRRKVA